MKNVLLLSFLGAMAVGAPAFAQTAGSPGATGSVGGASGSNPPGSAGTTDTGAPNKGMMKGNSGMSEGRAADTNGTMNQDQSK